MKKIKKSIILTLTLSIALLLVLMPTAVKSAENKHVLYGAFFTADGSVIVKGDAFILYFNKSVGGYLNRIWLLHGSNQSLIHGAVGGYIFVGYKIGATSYDTRTQFQTNPTISVVYNGSDKIIVISEGYLTDSSATRQDIWYTLNYTILPYGVIYFTFNLTLLTSVDNIGSIYFKTKVNRSLLPYAYIQKERWLSSPTWRKDPLISTWSGMSKDSKLVFYMGAIGEKDSIEVICLNSSVFLNLHPEQGTSAINIAFPPNTFGYYELNWFVPSGATSFPASTGYQIIEKYAIVLSPVDDTSTLAGHSIRTAHFSGIGCVLTFDNATFEAMCKELKELGVNTLIFHCSAWARAYGVWIAYPSWDALKQKVDIAHKYGLNVLLYVGRDLDNATAIDLGLITQTDFENWAIKPYRGVESYTRADGTTGWAIYMDSASGWRDFQLKLIDWLLGNCSTFDGFYFDPFGTFECNNTAHGHNMYYSFKEDYDLINTMIEKYINKTGRHPIVVLNSIPLYQFNRNYTIHLTSVMEQGTIPDNLTVANVEHFGWLRKSIVRNFLLYTQSFTESDIKKLLSLVSALGESIDVYYDLSLYNSFKNLYKEAFYSKYPFLGNSSHPVQYYDYIHNTWISSSDPDIVVSLINITHAYPKYPLVDYVIVVSEVSGTTSTTTLTIDLPSGSYVIYDIKNKTITTISSPNGKVTLTLSPYETRILTATRVGIAPVYGSPFSDVYYANFTSGNYTMILYAPSGLNSTVVFYIPETIMPDFGIITNASQWGYKWNSTTRLLTLWVVHSSPVKITISNKSSRFIFKDLQGNPVLKTVRVKIKRLPLKTVVADMEITKEISTILAEGNYTVEVFYLGIPIFNKTFEITTFPFETNLILNLLPLPQDYRNLKREMSCSAPQTLKLVENLSTKFPYSRVKVLINGTGDFTLIYFLNQTPTSINIISNVSVVYSIKDSYLYINGTLSSTAEVIIEDQYLLSIFLKDRLGYYLANFPVYINGTKYTSDSSGYVRAYLVPEDYLLDYPEHLNFEFYRADSITTRPVHIRLSTDKSLTTEYLVPAFITGFKISNITTASLLDLLLRSLLQSGSNSSGNIVVSGYLKDYYDNPLAGRTVYVNVTDLDTGFTAVYTATTESSGFFETSMIPVSEGKDYRITVVFQGDDTYTRAYYESYYSVPKAVAPAPVGIPYYYYLIAIAIVLILLIAVGFAIRTGKSISLKPRRYLKFRS